MSSLQTLLQFLVELEKRSISYRLEHSRSETIMVSIAVPGELWEVEFFDDGNIEIEVFGSVGGVQSIALGDLLTKLDPHSS